MAVQPLPPEEVNHFNQWHKADKLHFIILNSMSDRGVDAYGLVLVPVVSLCEHGKGCYGCMKGGIS